MAAASNAARAVEAMREAATRTPEEAPREGPPRATTRSMRTAWLGSNRFHNDLLNVTAAVVDGFHGRCAQYSVADLYEGIWTDSNQPAYYITIRGDPRWEVVVHAKHGNPLGNAFGEHHRNPSRIVIDPGDKRRCFMCFHEGCMPQENVIIWQHINGRGATWRRVQRLQSGPPPPRRGPPPPPPPPPSPPRSDEEPAGEPSPRCVWCPVPAGSSSGSSGSSVTPTPTCWL